MYLQVMAEFDTDEQFRPFFQPLPETSSLMVCMFRSVLGLGALLREKGDEEGGKKLLEQVCEKERESSKERERKKERERRRLCVCVCMRERLCVCERMRDAAAHLLFSFHSHMHCISFPESTLPPSHLSPSPLFLGIWASRRTGRCNSLDEAHPVHGGARHTDIEHVLLASQERSTGSQEYGEDHQRHEAQR